MTEQLGEAVLKITVDDGEAVRKLEELKKQLGVLKTGTTQAGTAQKPRSTSTNTGGKPDTQTKRAIDFENRLAKARENSARATEKSAAAERKQASANLQGRISSGLIGGAFPLLFGQGPGAALGGLAGGVAGGSALGFGLSLVGTGVGASFDALIARSKELAEALRDPIAAFDQLKAASTLSSRGLETYIQALIDSGQTAKAEQLIRSDLTQNINPTTAEALSQANDELARSYSNVQEKLSALLAGPAIAFLQWLDRIVDSLPIQGPSGEQPGQLPSASRAAALAEQGRLTQGSGLGLGAAAIGAIIGGALLTATGIGAPVGTSALVYGLTAASAVQVGRGKFQQAQGEEGTRAIAVDKATAATQKEIEAIQQRRAGIQKQLVSLTGAEQTAAAQVLTAQNAGLQASEAIARARKEYISLPASTTAEEEAVAFQALKDKIAAAKLQLDKYVAANNNAASALKKQTDLRASTLGMDPRQRQQTLLQGEVSQARAGYDVAQRATLTATDTNALKAAQSVENKLGQAWRAASLDLAVYNDELSRTLEKEQKAAQKNVASARKDVARAEKASEEASKNVAKAFESARKNALDISKALNQAARSIETSYQGAFEFLNPSIQNSLISGARARVQGAVNAGLFSQTAVNKLQGEEIFRADAALRGIQDAEQNYSDVTTQAAESQAAASESITAALDNLKEQNETLSEANTKLSESITELANKNWEVQVLVGSDGSSSVYGDAVNSAVSQ